MSTGSDLLRRLRQQQASHHNNKQQERDASTGKVAGDLTKVAEAENVTQKQHTSIENENISATHTEIEVCLGPDCSGSGGGAALLEIEELVSQSAMKTNSTSKKQSATALGKEKAIFVVPGGCRDFCTMGPNVHVRNTALGIDSHHTRVNCPETCRSVVDTIFGNEHEDIGTASLHNETGTSTETLLKKRVDGIRWRAHKKRSASERRLRVREK